MNGRGASPLAERAGLAPFTGVEMGHGNEHEVVRDATLTLAHILKTHLSPRLGNKPVEVVFDMPDEKAIDAAAKAGKCVLSLYHMDTVRATHVQINEAPVVRDEDDDGNIVEYRLGIPTFVKPRYLITAWSKDPLEAQVVQGLIIQLFFDHTSFLQDDIQGESIHVDDPCPITYEDSVKLEDLLNIWQALQRPFRSSLVYSVAVKLASARRVAIRRVQERILDYKKVDG